MPSLFPVYFVLFACHEGELNHSKSSKYTLSKKNEVNEGFDQEKLEDRILEISINLFVLMKLINEVSKYSYFRKTWQWYLCVFQYLIFSYIDSLGCEKLWDRNICSTNLITWDFVHLDSWTWVIFDTLNGHKMPEQTFKRGRVQNMARGDWNCI